jgi:hypothetical protein
LHKNARILHIHARAVNAKHEDATGASHPDTESAKLPAMGGILTHASHCK